MPQQSSSAARPTQDNAKAEKIRQKRNSKDIPRQSITAARLKQTTATPIFDEGVARAVKAVRQFVLRRDSKGALQQHADFANEGLTHVAIDNAALDACSKACDLQGALSIWHGMTRRDLLSYSTMITCCAATVKVELAEELWSQLHKEGLRPNLITYTAMMNVHSNTANLKRTLSLFNELMSNQLRPDALAYFAAMTACARAGAYTEARKLFNHMNQSKVPPQHRHYNSLITACALKEHGEVAEVIFRAMPDRGFEHTYADYTSLIACWRKDVAKCRQLLQEMEAAAVLVDQVALHSVAQAEWSAGNNAEVAALIRRARSMPGELIPPLQRMAAKLKV